VKPFAPRRAHATLAVALLSSVLIAAAWAFVASLIDYERADTIREAYRGTANLALAFEQHTIRTMKAAEQLLEYTRDQYLEHGAALDMEKLVALARADRELITTIAVTDASGRVVAGSRGIRGFDLSDREYFRAHRDGAPGGLRIGDPIAGRLSGLPTFPLSQRVDRGGRFAGTVAVGLNPEYFSDFYKTLDIGRNGMALLIRADGITLARRAGSETSFGQNMARSTLMREQAGHETGSFLSVGRVEGVPRYTSYRTVREFGLVVAVGASEDEALEPFRERRNVYLASGAVFTGLVALAAVLILVALARRRQQLDQHLRDEARFRATFDQAAIGVAHVALDGTVTKVNDKLCRMSGYDASELLGRKFIEFKFSEDRAPADAIRAAQLVHRSNVQRDARFRRKDGSAAWYDVSVSLVLDPQGRPDYFVSMLQDITERKEAQEQVLYQAQHDPLTRLPNRALFQDRLEQALRTARRNRWSAGLLFLDLDYFKEVNDRLGHAAGDALLVEVGTRLSESVRTSDTAARIGGDEFAVVLARLTRPRDSALVADNILAALAAPVVLQGEPHRITVSIGIALFPDDGADAEALLRAADAAMFRAKQGGRNRAELHTAGAGGEPSSPETV
jgi:diguanylate cyclase (GGDEF)-like protein/PAS domain S-box-containing protein